MTSALCHPTDLVVPVGAPGAGGGTAPSTMYSALLVTAKGFGDLADAALEDLLTALCDPIRRFASYQLRTHMDSGDMAEDVVQETLIRVAKSIRSCAATSDPQVLAWVRVIARNCLTDMYRSPASGLAARSVTQDLFEDMLATAKGWQEASIAYNSPSRESLLHVVMGVYADTAGSVAELFWLRLIRGLEWSEIAHELGTTAAGAKRRFQRAQQSMRIEIERRVAALPGTIRHEVQSLMQSFSVSQLITVPSAVPVKSSTHS